MNIELILVFNTKRNFYKNSLFESNRIESNKSPKRFYKWKNIIGIKFVTKLSLGLSHLREHTFDHSLKETLDPLCSCGMNMELLNCSVLLAS